MFSGQFSWCSLSGTDSKTIQHFPDQLCNFYTEFLVDLSTKD